MAKRRRKILGLPIGPRQPSPMRKAGKAAAVGLAVTGAAVASARVVRILTAHRPRHADPSVEARSARADMQRQLKSGHIDLEEALAAADGDEAIGRTRVKILLQNLPGVGPAGAAKAMEELGIDPARRVKGLGSHQRELLVERFGHNGSS